MAIVGTTGNGTLTGPMINGTTSTALVSATVGTDGTINFQDTIPGMTVDGQPFQIVELGLNRNGTTVSRHVSRDFLTFIPHFLEFLLDYGLETDWMG